jgi:NAD(P)-dependent dehydrogenase (short-subunit alcohol dehydrogenase family)
MSDNQKIALVTGGSRGLGKNISLQLANKGVNIILTYHTQKDEADKVVNEIKYGGGKAAALQLSTDKLSEFPNFFETLSTLLKEEFNTDCFDYLVNNAGIAFIATFTGTTHSQVDQIFNVQFKGVFFFTQLALNQMNNNGVIVNMSSRLAQAVMPGYSVYASMKGAIETLTRYQAKELAPRGIRVNSVAPGSIETDFAGGIIRDNPEYNSKIKAMTALGRVGLPEDIGSVVAFLCSEDARWITAQRIEVSGGINL